MQAFKKNIVFEDKVAITHQKLADLHVEVLKHEVYSLDLFPSNYYLFDVLKKHLKGGKL
jgi:hypothetical protein